MEAIAERPAAAAAAAAGGGGEGAGAGPRPSSAARAAVGVLGVARQKHQSGRSCIHRALFIALLFPAATFFFLSHSSLPWLVAWLCVHKATL